MVNEEVYRPSQSRRSRELLYLRLCGITYPDKNYKIRRENSPLACIEYIEKGAGMVQLNEQTFYPEEGDAYFLPVGANHHYFSDRENPWQKVFINLSGSLLDSLIEGYGLKGIYHFKGLDLRQELRGIVAAAKEGKEDCTEEIVCLLNRAFFKMNAHAKEESHTSDVAERMKEYLRNHAAEKFRLDSLCRYVSRSESQTIKIFKEAYGITPYAYFLDKKIRLARDMLLNTNLSIKQIADHLNFADEYYFSNVFKKKVGVTPSKYRKDF